jgi:2-keto-4-pentenoate hydratase/2-oxohepta-3-ene-1,7-dioic acid hydratase in catechol pathway
MGFRLANVDGRAALVDGDTWYDLEKASGGALSSDPMTAVAAHRDLHEIAAGLGEAEPGGRLDEVVLGPPVPRPRNAFGIGLNYRSHAAESNMELPQAPLVFAKFPSCIAGPTDDVVLRAERGDYEAELVVVIGQGGQDIPQAEAWDHVAGVTCGQDISDRALQFASKPPHFDLGKSRDTYGPIGPVLVSTDLLPVRDGLAITCDVNGERRQSDTTASLIFDVPMLITYISGAITLGPGDLIFTGTPEGVGATSRRFLAPGDVVTTTIEGIGTMQNRCV